MSSNRTGPITSARVGAAVAGLLLASAVAACGSSTTTPLAPTVTEHARPTPAQSRDDQPGGVAEVASKSPLDQPNSSVVHVAAPRPGDRATTGEKAAASGNLVAVNPCTLVSRAEAQQVSGRAIAGVSEAPLGPTCIYTVPRSSVITLSIQPGTLPRLSPSLRDKRRLEVSGHPAYCGTLGRQMLYVPAGTNSVLSVAAPCGVAQRLAAKALADLHR